MSRYDQVIIIGGFIAILLVSSIFAYNTIYGNHSNAQSSTSTTTTNVDPYTMPCDQLYQKVLSLQNQEENGQAGYAVNGYLLVYYSSVYNLRVGSNSFSGECSYP